MVDSSSGIRVDIESDFSQFATDVSKANVALEAIDKTLSKLNKHSNGSNKAIRALSKSLTTMADSNKAVADEAKKLITLYNKQNTAAKRLHKTNKSLGKSLRDIAITIGQAKLALLNFKSVSIDVLGYFLQIGSKFEKLNVLLSGMSLKTDIDEKLKEVNTQLSYLINLSKNAPFSFEGLQDVFVKLNTVGLEPTKGSLLGLTNAVAAFGGSEDELKRAGVALQQMAGKGVVSMEELRQQLGEAVPTALQLMAKGAGKSIGQFVKEVSTGTVEAKSAINAMIREMNLAYYGAAEKQMETAEGLIQRIKTNFMLLTENANKTSGLYDTIKDKLKDINDYISSGEAQDMLNDATVKLKLIIKLLSSLIEGLYNLRDIILAVFSFKVINTAVGVGFTKLSNQVKNLKLGLYGLTSQFTGTSKQAAKAISGVTSKLRTLQTFVLNLGKGLPGVIATIVTLIGVKLYGSFMRANEEAEQLKKNIDAIQKAGGDATKADLLPYTPETRKGTAREIQRIQAEIEKLENQRKRYSQTREQLLGFTWEEGGRQDKASVQKINEITEAIEKQQAILEKANKVNVEYEKQFQAQKLESADVTQKIIDDTNRFFQELNSKRIAEEKQIEADSNGNAKEALINSNKLRQEYANQIEERLKESKTAFDEYANQNQMFAQVSADVWDKIADNWKNLVKQLKDNPLVLTIGVESAEKQQQELDKETQKLAKQLAQLQTQNARGTAFTPSFWIDPKYRNYGEEVIKRQAESFKKIKALQEKEGYSGEKLTDEEITAKASLEVQQELVKEIGKEKKLRQDIEQTTKSTGKNENKLNVLLAKYHQEYATVSKLKEKNLDVTSEEVSQFSQLEALNELLVDKSKEREKIESAILDHQKAQAIIETENLKKQNEKGWADLRLSRTDDIDSYLDYYEKSLKKQLNWDKVYNNLSANEQAEMLKVKQDAMDLARAEWLDKNKSALQKTLEDTGKLADNLSSVYADAFNDIGDAIFDLVKNGKADFKELATSILDELSKVVIKAMLAKAALAAIGEGTTNTSSKSSSTNSTLNSILGILQLGSQAAGVSNGLQAKGTGDWTTTDGGKSYTRGYISKSGGWYTQKAHTGGIIGSDVLTRVSVSPEMFVGASKYHTGGIVGLKPDEQPAILQKGEGVFTKEQMKALGSNGAQQANVTVNVINNTQDDVSAEQSQPRFDGEKVILDVVLKNMSTPGSFRTNMMGMMK